MTMVPQPRLSECEPRNSLISRRCWFLAVDLPFLSRQAPCLEKPGIQFAFIDPLEAQQTQETQDGPSHKYLWDGFSPKSGLRPGVFYTLHARGSLA